MKKMCKMCVHYSEMKSNDELFGVCNRDQYIMPVSLANIRFCCRYKPIKKSCSNCKNECKGKLCNRYEYEVYCEVDE